MAVYYKHRDNIDDLCNYINPSISEGKRKMIVLKELVLIFSENPELNEIWLDRILDQLIDISNEDEFKLLVKRLSNKY